MRSRRVAAIAAALTTLAVAAPASAGAASPRLDRIERSVVTKLNGLRASAGVRPLRRAPRLARAAEAKSRSIVATGDFSHADMTARVRRFARARSIGETLAWVLPWQGDQADVVVAAWMASPSHRATLLSPRFRRIGVARRAGRLGASDATVFTVDVASAR
jgi:uncharacterized protein YkwD